MTLNVYLNFGGNCREVFEFYRCVFGGEFSVMETFGNGPPDMGVSEADRDLIMHMSLPVGSSVLMGSDMPSGFGGPPVVGNNFSISYLTQSREETDSLFAKLSEGGTVTMPLQDMFWGSYFGAFTDKFGINWQFNYEIPQG